MKFQFDAFQEWLLTPEGSEAFDAAANCTAHCDAAVLLQKAFLAGVASVTHEVQRVETEEEWHAMSDTGKSPSQGSSERESFEYRVKWMHRLACQQEPNPRGPAKPLSDAELLERKGDDYAQHDIAAMWWGWTERGKRLPQDRSDATVWTCSQCERKWFSAAHDNGDCPACKETARTTLVQDDSGNIINARHAAGVSGLPARADSVPTSAVGEANEGECGSNPPGAHLTQPTHPVQGGAQDDVYLRSVARQHAREAVTPIGSRAGSGPSPALMQALVRQEEIIFYALKEAFKESGGSTAEGDRG